MQFFKKIFLLFLPVFMTLQTFPLTAFAETTDDFNYTLKSDGTAEISCHNVYLEKAEIPSEIDGHIITSLAENCFADCTALKTVSIPDSVTAIGAYAFYGCSALEEIKISEFVTSIGDFAFDATETISAFTVDEKNPAYQSPDGVLYNKSGDTLIKYPESKADASYAVLDSCQKIADWAFIGSQNLQQIDLNHVRIIGADAFCWCVALKEVSIPEGVVELDGAVFSYCKDLERVTLPSTVTAIGERCFYSCTNLKQLNLPEGLKKMGAYAICHCTSLTELLVPKSLENVNIDCMGYAYDEEKDDYYVQENLTLYVYRNSTAWRYAATNHIAYEYVQTGTVYYILIAVFAVVIIILIIAIVKVLKNRRESA